MTLSDSKKKGSWLKWLLIPVGIIGMFILIGFVSAFI